MQQQQGQQRQDEYWRTQGVIPSGDPRDQHRPKTDVLLPGGVVDDIFRESREWRQEVKDFRLEVGKVRETAAQMQEVVPSRTTTAVGGWSVGLIMGLFLMALIAIVKKPPTKPA